MKRSLGRNGSLIKGLVCDSYGCIEYGNMRKMVSLMAENIEILESLFGQGQIDLRKGKIFDYSPAPMPADFDFNRICA